MAVAAASTTATPLAPPPDLLGMRALSPPMSLFPELASSVPLPPLSLDAAAAAVSVPLPTAPAPSAVSTAAAIAAVAPTATAPTVIAPPQLTPQPTSVAAAAVKTIPPPATIASSAIAAPPAAPSQSAVAAAVTTPAAAVMSTPSTVVPPSVAAAAPASAAVAAAAIPMPSAIAASSTSVATATAMPASLSAAKTAAALAADERRRAATYTAASLLKKVRGRDALSLSLFPFDAIEDAHKQTLGTQRKSADSFPDPSAAPSAATSTPASSLAAAAAAAFSSANTATTSAASAPVTPSPLGAAAAASLQSIAREKVMKEPQSGDLYECVITKRNGGLGLTLACVDDHVQITGLAPDTPAANSGICVGDTLVAVSGLPVRGLQFSTVIGRLKSSSRNSVVLKLRRNPCRSRLLGRLLLLLRVSRTHSLYTFSPPQ
ncbi:hypothetical protein PINS_up012581 [Pythium insidiosum]|nr:hypothetical protein PINS_up012581 [Pythium insidiosum]